MTFIVKLKVPPSKSDSVFVIVHFLLPNQ